MLHRTMEVAHDEKSDSPTVIFDHSNSVSESDEDKRGAIRDCDNDGSLVSLEVLGASSRRTGAGKKGQPGSMRDPPRWPHSPPSPPIPPSGPGIPGRAVPEAQSKSITCALSIALCLATATIMAFSVPKRTG
jgi:hypothetical protein